VTAISKVVSLLVISVALTLSGSPVFAKSGGGPSQVKTSGTSAAPSGSTGTHSKHVTPPRVLVCRVGASGRRNCWYAPGGTTQPACKGPHKGPNGVMIQCD